MSMCLRKRDNHYDRRTEVTESLYWPALFFSQSHTACWHATDYLDCFLLVTEIRETRNSHEYFFLNKIENDIFLEWMPGGCGMLLLNGFTGHPTHARSS